MSEHIRVASEWLVAWQCPRCGAMHMTDETHCQCEAEEEQDEVHAMSEHKMWAVVDKYDRFDPIRVVDATKQGAKNSALAKWESQAKWAYAKEYLGWRVVPVTVTVPDEEER